MTFSTLQKLMICITILPLALPGAMSLCSTAEDPKNLTANEWKEDIEFLVRQINFFHPNPYTIVDRETFDREVRGIIADAGTASDTEIAVRVMQLVENLGDGHSYFKPSKIAGFDRWFPVRFYNFSDGMAITCISPDHRDLLGARVVKLGGVDVEKVSKLCASLEGAENEFGKRERVYLLSNAGVLSGLDLVPLDGKLCLDVITLNNEEKSIELESIKSSYNLSMKWSGEIEGPPMRRNWVGPFPGKSFVDYYRKDPEKNLDLPLHLRSRRAYWWTHDLERDFVFMQWNSHTSQSSYSKKSLEDTYQEMFKFIDANQVPTVILDIRYNGGGDGGLNTAFINEIVKRESSFNQGGRFFVLVGQKTYSAAAMLVQELRLRTNAMFVGTPPGQYANNFGDPATVVLPNSGCTCTISSLHWQLTRSDDLSNTFNVDFPAFMTAKQYFDKKDPVLQAALDARGKQTIYGIASSNGADAAIAEYKVRKKQFADIPWWGAGDELRLNDLGYKLLRSRQNSAHLQAVEIMRINAESNPSSWNAWDSFADALIKIGKIQEAVEAYRNAMKACPTNWNLPAQKAFVEQHATK